MYDTTTRVRALYCDTVRPAVSQSHGQEQDKGRNNKMCLDIVVVVHGDDVPMTIYSHMLVQ